MEKFRASLKFFFYILRLCGLNAIDLGQKPAKVSKLWTTYSLLFFVGYLYFHVSTVQVDLKAAAGVNFVTALIDYYNKYSPIVLFLTSILVTLIRQPRLIDFLSILEDHDSLLEGLPVEREINYARDGRIPIFWLSIHGLAIGAFEYSNCIMYIQDFITYNENCLFMCTVPLFIATATLIQFAYFVTLIRGRLQLIGELLKGNRMPSAGYYLPAKFNYRQQHDGDGKKLDIKTIEMLFEKLYAATEILGSVFGLQLVVLLTTLFITLTTLSYFTCIQVIRLSAREAITTTDDIIGLGGTGLWIFIFLVKVFTMCYHCQRIRDEGAACGWYLHHYLMDYRYLRERKGIRLFSQQVLRSKFDIVPCGFFTLDMKMGFSLLGATFTYIIILIQFDRSQ